MEYGVAALWCLVSMLFLLILGVPIVYSLGFSALVFGYVAFGGAALSKIGWITFHSLYGFSWVPLPLFILMAVIIAETNLGEDIFGLASKWLSRLPGSLVSASIIGEAALAATMGISGAAIITVGKIADPQFQKYGYNRAFAMCGVVCGGVLGPLIPPSVPLIIYGIVSDTSVGHLFIAGIIPGIILACILAIVPILIVARIPQSAPPIGSISWAERFKAIKAVWPIALVFFSMIGSIYLGIATPSEAAGVGCVVVILLAFLLYGLPLERFKRAVVEAAEINGMMLAIVAMATFFTYVVGSSNFAKDLGIIVSSLQISPIAVIVLILVILLVLGLFIDALTITLLTVPVFVPLITQLGFDPIWFGILFVVMTEAGLLTPPMGINLFYVRTVFNISSNELLRGILPYFIGIMILICILVAFPQIALWLPGTM
jgi:C4-dicarboxylate transporter DctM subunit